MTSQKGAVQAFTDDRGTLVPVDLPDAGIDVQRVFVVMAPEGGSRRGDHRLSCREVIALVTGGATVEIGPGSEGPFEHHELNEPGQYVVAGPDDWLHYALHDDRSVVLVLADAPYVPQDDRPGAAR